jgi:hypothetical protein
MSPRGWWTAACRGTLLGPVAELKGASRRIRSATIAEPGHSPTIDVVHGRPDDATAEELLAFWAAQGALDAAEARRRLPEVVCVLRAEDGSLAGVCSAFVTDLPLIGGRRFFVLRSLLPGHAREHLFALFEAAYAALDASYDGASGEPIGLCLLLGERERRLRPEAEWPNPRTIYAGYLADGRQVRIAYFTAARSVSGPPVEAGYHVVPFAAQDEVGPDDLIALWTGEGVLPEAEARRRVDEVLLVAVDDAGKLAGITTRYLQRNEQLRMDLWHIRAFTAEAYRKSSIATALAVRGREHLEEAFVSGRDTRAGGLLYEVESEILKRLFPNAVWKPADVLFIGENEQGAHVRVHFFPGALAPEPG